MFVTFDGFSIYGKRKVDGIIFQNSKWTVYYSWSSIQKEQVTFREPAKNSSTVQVMIYSKQIAFAKQHKFQGKLYVDALLINWSIEEEP